MKRHDGEGEKERGEDDPDDFGQVCVLFKCYIFPLQGFMRMRIGWRDLAAINSSSRVYS